MALPALKKIKAEDRVLNQVQDSVAQALKPLLNMAIADGRLIENIEITSGTASIVEHKLDRTIRGWIVVRKNANSNIWESTSSIPDKTLILNASATVTVSLWVF